MMRTATRRLVLGLSALLLAATGFSGIWLVDEEPPPLEVRGAAPRGAGAGAFLASGEVLANRGIHIGADLKRPDNPPPGIVDDDWHEVEGPDMSECEMPAPARVASPRPARKRVAHVPAPAPVARPPVPPECEPPDPFVILTAATTGANRTPDVFWQDMPLHISVHLSNAAVWRDRDAKHRSWYESVDRFVRDNQHPPPFEYEVPEELVIDLPRENGHSWFDYVELGIYAVDGSRGPGTLILEPWELRDLVQERSGSVVVVDELALESPSAALALPPRLVRFLPAGQYEVRATYDTTGLPPYAKAARLRIRSKPASFRIERARTRLAQVEVNISIAGYYYRRQNLAAALPYAEAVLSIMPEYGYGGAYDIRSRALEQAGRITEAITAHKAYWNLMKDAPSGGCAGFLQSPEQRYTHRLHELEAKLHQQAVPEEP